MTFDNEHQRELILMLIQNVPMQGSFKQIERAMQDLYTLRDAVTNAEVQNGNRRNPK